MVVGIEYLLCMVMDRNMCMNETSDKQSHCPVVIVDDDIDLRIQ